jgi:hypothetical protein
LSSESKADHQAKYQPRVLKARHANLPVLSAKWVSSIIGGRGRANAFAPATTEFFSEPLAESISPRRLAASAARSEGYSLPTDIF